MDLEAVVGTGIVGQGTAPGMPVTDVSWREAVEFCNRLSHAAGRRPCYSEGDDVDAQDVVWALFSYSYDERT
ncbi:MAG: hypothetical protein ACJ72W_07625 [Actinoallomurus sp.]